MDERILERRRMFAAMYSSVLVDMLNMAAGVEDDEEDNEEMFSFIFNTLCDGDVSKVEEMLQGVLDMSEDDETVGMAMDTSLEMIQAFKEGGDLYIGDGQGAMFA